MAQAALTNPHAGEDARFEWVIRSAAVLGALAAFGTLTLLALLRNGWSFEYPLDDVYIHLAMAEQIAKGGYGVNSGEAASAASSPLYPLLLTPFADSAIQRWWPVLWNLAALVVASVLFASALVYAGFGRAGVVLGAVAPLALSMYLTAFTGMENMAHGAASLAIVLGLWRFVEMDRIGWLLIAGVLLAPAFRLEGLALALAAGGVVAVLGRPFPGLGLMALASTPVVIFAMFLVSQGLQPLPSSVIAKLGDTAGAGGVLGKFGANVQTYGGRYLVALVLVLGGLGAATFQKNRRRAYFALAVAAAGFSHLAFGAVGWMDRYENYAVISLVAALALVLVDNSTLQKSLLVGTAMIGGLLTYGPYALSVYAWNPAAISAQQGQMARFAKDFVKAPVAVNDLGLVAWRNPNYVLDLWGLASSEALELRTSGASDGWAGDLAETTGVEVAMIYDRWLGRSVPPAWVRLGTLQLEVPDAFLGGPEVAFYATQAGDLARLRDAIQVWEKDLPAGASFRHTEEGG